MQDLYLIELPSISVLHFGEEGILRLLINIIILFLNSYLLFPAYPQSSLEKKSLLRDNVDILGSLADLYFRAGDNKNAVLKFEQAQMLDPYLIKGRRPGDLDGLLGSFVLLLPQKFPFPSVSLVLLQNRVLLSFASGQEFEMTCPARERRNLLVSFLPSSWTDVSSLQKQKGESSAKTSGEP